MALGLVASVPIARLMVIRAAAGHVTDDASALTPEPVAVVLGAGVYSDGTPTPALRDRVHAAAQLYTKGTGFDTWDSCARAKAIFGVDHAIVVTHSFHADRAVALCREAGIDAEGLAVADLPGDIMTKLRTREWLASPKAVYELVIDPDPTFLGAHEGLTGSVHRTNGE